MEKGTIDQVLEQRNAWEAIWTKCPTSLQQCSLKGKTMIKYKSVLLKLSFQVHNEIYFWIL